MREKWAWGKIERDICLYAATMIFFWCDSIANRRGGGEENTSIDRRRCCVSSAWLGMCKFFFALSSVNWAI